MGRDSVLVLNKNLTSSPPCLPLYMKGASMDNMVFILQKKTKNVLECIEAHPGSCDECDDDILKRLQTLEMVNAAMELTEKGKKCLEKIRELYSMVSD